jgi:hypothetical protein
MFVRVVMLAYSEFHFFPEQILLPGFGWTWIIWKKKNCRVGGYPVDAIAGLQRIQ